MSKSLHLHILTAFCTALIAVLAQVVIPIPLIPITGQTLAIGLIVTILGLKYGTLSVLLYIALGVIGLPVFQSFTGGLGILFGPTGGYILGFIFTALVMGLYYQWFGVTFTHALIANLLGMIVTLAFGAAWLKLMNGLSWQAAFISGVLPFIIGGIIKALIAAWLGVIVRQRLKQARLLPHAV
ncbi:MAG: biotin transporter BioY [Solibacillus sp.]